MSWFWILISSLVLCMRLQHNCVPKELWLLLLNLNFCRIELCNKMNYHVDCELTCCDAV
jgi:hypothetical protein